MCEIKDLTVYRDIRQLPILDNMNLKFDNNSCVAIVGTNGSGKTTLAFSLIGLIPFYYKGKVKGDFLFGKTNLFSLPIQERLKSISYVFQDFESQILFGNVKDILGLNESNESHSIICDLINVLGVDKLLNKKPNELSSGEAQKIALISALRNNPKLIIYDEATSALDYQTKIKFQLVIEYLLKRGKNILLLGQNRKLLNTFSNKTFFILNGSLSDIPILQERPKLNYKTIGALFKNNASCPFEFINIEHIIHSYKNWIFCLNVNNFNIKRGETIAIIGDNGSGKTTFLNCISGYIRPQQVKMNISRGELQDNIFMIFSSPSFQFFEPTIKDELNRINPKILEKFDLIQSVFPFLELDKDPFGLSFGEQKTLALIEAILSSKSILIFDEPELGIDEDNLHLLKYLFKLNMYERKRTIIYSTHDLQLATNFSSRVVMFKQGEIVKSEPTNKQSLESWFAI